MKKLDKIIHSNVHKICAPVSGVRNLRASIDIIAQHIAMRARFSFLFVASEIKPLIFKYLPVKKIVVRFKNSTAKPLIISYLKDKSGSVSNKLLLLSSACMAAITGYLKSASDNIVIFSSSAVRISCGRYRLLYDMDDSAIAVFDNMTLEDADYIFFD